MSKNTISLRIMGYLDQIEDLTQAVGLPAMVTRRGELNRIGELQEVDVVVFKLASWADLEPGDQHEAEREQLLPAASKLQQIAPVLTSLDRSHCMADLYVSSIRREEQGGLEFPEELIAAAAMCRLKIGISILVQWGVSDVI